MSSDTQEELALLRSDSKAQLIELQWLRQELIQDRASRAAETKDLRKKLKAAENEAAKVSGLENRITELEQEYRIMQRFAKMGPQIYDEAKKLRKELEGTKKLNQRLRKENNSLQRAKRTVTPEPRERPSVASTRVAPGTRRAAEETRAVLEELGRDERGRRVALGVYIDPEEVAEARRAMEEHEG